MKKKKNNQFVASLVTQWLLKVKVQKNRKIFAVLFQVGNGAILLFQIFEFKMTVKNYGQDEGICVCRYCDWADGGEKGEYCRNIYDHSFN